MSCQGNNAVMPSEAALSPSADVHVRSASHGVSGRPKKHRARCIIVDPNGDGELQVFSPGSRPMSLPPVARLSSTSPLRSSPLSPDGHRRGHSAFEPLGSKNEESQIREGGLYRARILRGLRQLTTNIRIRRLHYLLEHRLERINCTAVVICPM